MSGLIVPGVARFTVNATYSDLPVANILDMHIDVGGITSRTDACADQAAIIVSAWKDHVTPNLVDRYKALTVSWVDMNADDGSTGEVTNGTGSDFPAYGSLAHQGLPGNCAFLIHKQLTAGRGSRAGRLYLPGIDEAATDHDSPNLIQGAFAADVTAGFAAFLSAINQEAGIDPPQYDSELVVVHTRNTAGPGEDPVIEYVGRSHVDALVCATQVATQRRRLR